MTASANSKKSSSDKSAAMRSDCDSVLAMMLFSRDEVSRASYEAMVRLERALAVGGRITLSPRHARALLDGRSRVELKERARAATSEGSLVGDMVIGQFLMLRDGGTASREAAIKSYRAWVVDGRKTFGDGTPIPKSRQTLINAWDRMKPVAHLWAARRLWNVLPKLYKAAPPTSADELMRFLSVAKAFGEFASTTNAHGQVPASPLIPTHVLVSIDRNIKPAPLLRICAPLSNRS